jgi:hypothetical protein
MANPLASFSKLVAKLAAELPFFILASHLV